MRRSSLILGRNRNVRAEAKSMAPHSKAVAIPPLDLAASETTATRSRSYRSR